MSTTFLFIDATKTDRSTRRIARSHAMKGKNLGKKHSGRRKKDISLQSKLQKLSDSDVTARDARDDESMQAFHLPESSSSSRAPGKEVVIPAHFEPRAPYSQHAVKQFFTEVTECLNPPALCATSHGFRPWLGVFFSNLTAYHCTMALIGTLNHYFFGRHVMSSQIISHLTQAVVLVNQSLDTDEATCDANIYVVSFMAVHELLNGVQDRALVHLRGLQRMVDLRGGLKDLEPNPELLAKVCKTDLDVTLHFGTSPAFYRDRMPDVYAHMASSGLVGTQSFIGLDCYPVFRDLNPDLQEILLDVYNVTTFSNQGCRMDSHMLQETIASFGYRLVRFHSVGGQLLRNQLDSICHIALVALTTTLFFQIGRRRLLQYELIGQHLKDVVDTGLEGVDPDVKLWLLFIGGVSVLPEREEKWLLKQMQKTVRDGLVQDWEDAHQRLLRFPWIASLYDMEAQRIWQLAQS